MSIAAPWYCVLLAFAAKNEGVPSRRTLQATYIVIGLIATLFGLTDYGWITLFQTGAKNVWVLLTGGVVISSLLSSLLFLHLRQLRRDAQQSSFTLVQSQQALEIERTHKEQAQADARTDYLT